MLLTRDNEPFRIAEALAWSATWGMGVALGVAAGGWLTVVGGSGAPGAEGLQPVSDLVVLPAMAFAIVVAAQMVVRVAVAALRGRRADGRNEQGQR